MIEFTRKYANNNQAREEFFLRDKYPNSYYCEKCVCTHYRKISTRNHVYTCSKCGHQSYLFAGTIFQDCKLDLYKLLLGLFIFFTSNKGVSTLEMRSQLDVNYKTALSSPDSAYSTISEPLSVHNKIPAGGLSPSAISFFL